MQSVHLAQVGDEIAVQFQRNVPAVGSNISWICMPFLPDTVRSTHCSYYSAYIQQSENINWYAWNPDKRTSAQSRGYSKRNKSGMIRPRSGT